MPKYMVQFNYSKVGGAGLLKDGGSKRKDIINKSVKAAGGKLETLYFAFGKYDAVVIADLPDNTTAAALSLAVGATGAGECVTTPLLTVDEVDQAVKKHVDYTAPGAK